MGSVGLGGIGVTCSPRDPKFAISNSAEIDRFFQDVKIIGTSHPGGIDGKISVRIIYSYYLFFHRHLIRKLCLLSCRPFVVNAPFLTGLVVSSVSCLGC